MKTKNIRQSVNFNASPEAVYELIMDSAKLAAFTGNAAKTSRKPNGKFHVFGGYCRGYNIELEPPKKIVQAWHFAEDGWPDDHFSVCTFTLAANGKGTKLSFAQTGVPEHKAKSLSDGWKQYFWSPMKAFLAK